MLGVLTAFKQDKRGTALIEYSLVAALVALGVLSMVADLGVTLNQLYDAIRLGVAAVGTGG